MALRLHNFPASPNGRKVLAVALELGVELESVLVDMMKGGHKDPSFLAKNPNGKVPVLEDDGWYLNESVAIMQHLCTKKPDNGIYPSEPKLRAEVNKWLVWDAAHFAMESCFPVYFQRMFAPMLGVPVQDQIEKSGVDNFNRFAAVLNGAVEGKQFLVGDRFTIADIAVVGTLMYRDAAKLDLTPYPHLKSYVERIEQRDSWKKTAPPKMG